MSVVVEMVTLVVRRDSLDAKYPGGSEAFLAEVVGPALDARWVCGDPHLVAVGLQHRRPDAILSLLNELGLQHTIGDALAPVDMCFVNALTGPAASCPWLSFQRRPDRVSLAWWAGDDPGELVRPRAWRPMMYLQHAAHAEDRVLKLGEEDGVESWLDQATGAIYTAPADPLGDTPGPLMKTLCRALERRDWSYTVRGPRVVRASFVAGVVRCDLDARVHESDPLLVCTGVLPFRVPDVHRSRVFAHLMGANARLRRSELRLDRESHEVLGVVRSDFDDVGLDAAGVDELLDELVRTCRIGEELVALGFSEWSPPVSIEPTSATGPGVPRWTKPTVHIETRSIQVDRSEVEHVSYVIGHFAWTLAESQELPRFDPTLPTLRPGPFGQRRTGQFTRLTFARPANFPHAEEVRRLDAAYFEVYNEIRRPRKFWDADIAVLGWLAVLVFLGVHIGVWQTFAREAPDELPAVLSSGIDFAPLLFLLAGVSLVGWPAFRVRTYRRAVVRVDRLTAEREAIRAHVLLELERCLRGQIRDI